MTGELSLHCAKTCSWRVTSSGWTVRCMSANMTNSAIHPLGVDKWVVSWTQAFAMRICVVAPPRGCLRVKADMVLFADNTVWTISERVRGVREDALYKSTLPYLYLIRWSNKNRTIVQSSFLHLFQIFYTHFNGFLLVYGFPLHFTRILSIRVVYAKFFDNQSFNFIVFHFCLQQWWSF